VRRWLLVGLLVFSGCATPQRRRADDARVPEKAKAVVRTARAYLPEENPKAKPPADCSDFIRKVFARNGIWLPRTAAQMSRLGKPVGSARDLRMGDLLFFSGEEVSSRVGHVALYVSQGIFIHVARPELGARLESLYTDYYRKRYITARRLIF